MNVHGVESKSGMEPKPEDPPTWAVLHLWITPPLLWLGHSPNPTPAAVSRFLSIYGAPTISQALDQMLTNCFLSGIHILPQLCLIPPLPTHGSLWPAGQSPKVMEQHLGPFRTSFHFVAHFLFHPAKLQAPQALALSL